MARVEQKSNAVLLMEYINTTREFLFDQIIASVVPGKIDVDRTRELYKLRDEQEDFARSLGLAINLEYAKYLEKKYNKAWKQCQNQNIEYFDFKKLIAREKGQEERLEYLQSQNN